MLLPYTDAVLEMGRKILRGESFSGRERHCVYLNTGGPRFANISAVSGLDFPEDGRGMAVTDWDFDGDADLWISNRTAPRVRLLRNDTAAGNRFVAIRLTGNGTTSNRDAIGARLTLRAGGVSLLRTLKAGEGFLSQSSRWLHFGLGKQGAIESLTIRWPDGSEQTLSSIEPDRFYDMRQGEDIPTLFSPPGPRAPLSPSVVEVPPPTEKMRLRLIARTPLPRLAYEDFTGNTHRVREHLDKPLLLNLWASWCAPCKTELDELRDAGAHVLALSLDGLGQESPTTRQDARDFWAANGYGFDAGFADENLIELLQFYHQVMFLDRRPFPVPTSFLIDTDGTVGAIYKGPVTAAEIDEDIAHLRDEPQQRRARAVPFTGRWQGELPEVTPTELARAFVTDDMLGEAMAYLEEFGSDHGNPLRPQVFMELAQKLRRQGHSGEAQMIANAAVQLSERQVRQQKPRASRETALMGPPIGAEVESLAWSEEALFLRIAVDVPPGHHGYIDKGDDGYFIPLSFAFPDLEQKGIEAEITSVTPGVRDEKVRAQVLRGRADFAFRLAPAPPRSADLTARIRYQICNDITEICYPPGQLGLPITSPTR